jgi:hypothetical protein
MVTAEAGSGSGNWLASRPVARDWRLGEPNGSRRWVLDYQPPVRDARTCRTLPADEALKLARRHRVAIDGGRDPLARRKPNDGRRKPP